MAENEAALDRLNSQRPIEGSGPQFVSERGIAAPLMMDNVDTDVIAPIGKPPNPGSARETRAFEPIRFFADGREKPDFILNQEGFRRASIILAGKNFGTGSSRSVAVSRPLDGGIRVVIAESFGPLFYDNSIRLGLLAVPLEGSKIEEIAQWSTANPGQSILVDLERQIIEVEGLGNYPFRVEPRVREKLLNGYTVMEELSRLEPEIDTFSANYRQKNPWVYETGN